MKPEATKVAVELAGGKQLSIETGKMPRQAGGAAVVRFGENVVLAARPPIRAPRGHRFFSRSRSTIANTPCRRTFPGGFIKREGRMKRARNLTAANLTGRSVPCRRSFSARPQVIANWSSPPTPEIRSPMFVALTPLGRLDLRSFDYFLLGPIGAVASASSMDAHRPIPTYTECGRPY